MDKAVLVLSGNSREQDRRFSDSRALHVPLCREKWQLSVLWTRGHGAAANTGPHLRLLLQEISCKITPGCPQVQLMSH